MPPFAITTTFCGFVGFTAMATSPSERPDRLTFTSFPRVNVVVVAFATLDASERPPGIPKTDCVTTADGGNTYVVGRVTIRLLLGSPPEEFPLLGGATR